MKWLYDNDKISFSVGLWIYHVEVTLYFFPFLWRKPRLSDGIIEGGPFFLELYY